MSFKTIPFPDSDASPRASLVLENWPLEELGARGSLTQCLDQTEGRQRK